MNHVMTDEDIEALRQRNAERLEEIKRKMSTKYLLHPENKITRAKFRKALRKSKALMLNV